MLIYANWRMKNTVDLHIFFYKKMRKWYLDIYKNSQPETL